MKYNHAVDKIVLLIVRYNSYFYTSMGINTSKACFINTNSGSSIYEI